MITSPLWQFVALLAVHWLGDFVLQTHWQASNKSKNITALLRHVGNYSLVLGVCAVVIFGPTMGVAHFLLVNSAAHLVTDYFTSRWSSRLFAAAVEELNFSAARSVKGHPPLLGLAARIGKCWHDFFVAIGLDQLIHQVTLAATMWWFLWAL